MPPKRQPAPPSDAVLLAALNDQRAAQDRAATAARSVRDAQAAAAAAYDHATAAGAWDFEETFTTLFGGKKR